MILGLSLVQFTFLHVFLSLVGIGAGIFLVFGLLTSRRLSILTALFLVTTLFTNLTGFLFPFKGVTPGIILGILSTIVLIVAIVALYVKHLVGIWRSCAHHGFAGFRGDADRAAADLHPAHRARREKVQSGLGALRAG